MKIGIGNDHAAYEMKFLIVDYLKSKGHDVINYGCDNKESVDYPKYAEKVCNDILNKKLDCGILICGTGLGMSLAANKVKGIRCAVCSEAYSAKMCKQHNNANVLAFGARVVGIEVAKMMVDEWLNTKFEERHQKRLDMITDLEKKL